MVNKVILNFSIDKWVSNNSICPICRRVIKNKLKIIFDFKSNPTVEKNTSNIHGNDILQDTISENVKLTKENQILRDEKNKITEDYISLNEQVEFYAGKFAEVNVCYIL